MLLGKKSWFKATSKIGIEHPNFDIVLVAYKKKKDIAASYIRSMKPSLDKFLDHMSFLKDQDIYIEIEDFNDKDTEGHYLDTYLNGEMANVKLANEYKEGHDIAVDIYALDNIVHEFGHVIDVRHGYDQLLSDKEVFLPIYHSYLRLYKDYHEQKGVVPTEKELNYFLDKREVFARTFQAYYLTHFENDKIGASEKPMVNNILAYKTMREVGQYGIDYFDLVIPELGDIRKQLLAEDINVSHEIVDKIADQFDDLSITL